jgi:hypothetical protein
MSELAVKAEVLSRELAAFNAKAVAARGLSRAEGARAAAAGAEAQALQVGAACGAVGGTWCAWLRWGLVGF